MNAAQCASHPTFIGSVLEKCYRISPDRHYTMLAAGSHRRWIPCREYCLKLLPDNQLNLRHPYIFFGCFGKSGMER